MSEQLTVHLESGRRVVARLGDFEIATDQAVDNGGSGSAPEPFDLFLASIGTCAGAYVSAFCRQREIPTEDIRIVQSWQRDEDHRLTAVDVALELPDAFPQRYRTAILRAVEQCSVKRALRAPPGVPTRVV